MKGRFEYRIEYKTEYKELNIVRSNQAPFLLYVFFLNLERMITIILLLMMILISPSLSPVTCKNLFEHGLTGKDLSYTPSCQSFLPNLRALIK